VIQKVKGDADIVQCPVIKVNKVCESFRRHQRGESHKLALTYFENSVNIRCNYCITVVHVHSCCYYCK